MNGYCWGVIPHFVCPINVNLMEVKPWAMNPFHTPSPFVTVKPPFIVMVNKCDLKKVKIGICFLICSGNGIIVGVQGKMFLNLKS